jgi:radical SAM superfamily enzyme YgiQ (UPF0313 family)
MQTLQTSKAKVAFPVIGAENLSVQALSANLKKHGHDTYMVFDPALFDDKNFLCYSWMEKLFCQRSKVVKQILEQAPDLVAFSVMTPTFQWANEISIQLKKSRPDLPILFGGVHPTLVPEVCLESSTADIICVGEGDDAIVELADSIAEGKIRTDIENLWFKKENGIIQNPQRRILEDIDVLPQFDKELYEPYLTPRNNLLIVMSRGCPFHCSFCTLYKYAEDADKQNVDRVRLRSPEIAIQEIKQLKEKYGYTWIEFKDNTFTANKKWLRKFLPLLKKEVDLPFKCFVHPATLTEEVVLLLKENGCWGVQMGIESLSYEVRTKVLNRNESDTTIQQAFRLLDEAELIYSTDYILGLPLETEQNLEHAAKIFMSLKSCHRVSPFLLAYLPKHPITSIAHSLNILSDEDIRNLENGDHDHYLGYGSINEKRDLKRYLAFKYFFRLIPHLPHSVNRFFLRTGLFRIFSYIPFFGELVTIVDVIFALLINEPDIRSYLKHYIWTLRKVLTNSYYPKSSEGPSKATKVSNSSIFSQASAK